MLQLRPRNTKCHGRKRSHPRDSRPTNGTYRDVVDSPVAPSLARARFGRFVARTLDAARDRGLTDADIKEATGIGPSTFHRWKRGAGRGLPELEKVRAFCRGLGADLDEAMTALGARPGRDNPEPEPPMPPEIRKILRHLADPNVPERNKIVTREMLHMLAERIEAASRRGRQESQGKAG